MKWTGSVPGWFRHDEDTRTAWTPERSRTQSANWAITSREASPTPCGSLDASAPIVTGWANRIAALYVTDGINRMISTRCAQPTVFIVASPDSTTT